MLSVFVVLSSVRIGYLYRAARPRIESICPIDSGVSASRYPLDCLEAKNGLTLLPDPVCNQYVEVVRQDLTLEWAAGVGIVNRL